MAGLHLYRSNRLEALADALAGILKKPLPSPLQGEIVAVQSLGMRRWLSYALAQRLGVTANVEFPFPAALAQDIFEAALGDRPKSAAFDRELLPWRILHAFPQLLALPASAELLRYVTGDQSPLKHYQLALRIAAVFDRYLAYRPELLLEWDRAPAVTWQQHLWQTLTSRDVPAHPAALLKRLTTHLAKGPVRLAEFPSRITVFGISSLPPFYIDLLGAAAQCVDVHLFHLEPTDQFWGDIVSPRERDRMAGRLRLQGLTLEDLHIEAGNPLLGSTGGVGRDFSQLILNLDSTTEEELFVEPSGTTMLAGVQGDIFAMIEPAPSEINPGDHSIQVHCCHGPTREVEVLHDQLLDLFQRLPDLEPRDILVVMPDVETYAPFIEAVFGAVEDETRHIPFTIADRAARSESGIADAFLRVLDLRGGRFGAATLLDLLEVAPLRERFGITEEDLPRLHAWTEQAGIRWGIDGTHRQEFGLPSLDQNSWRAGFDRLLLGYALDGGPDQLFDGILPHRDLEGGSALLLGQFVEFAETLFRETRQLAEPRSLAMWAETFGRLVAALFADDDESADELRRLRRNFESLGLAMTETGCSGPIDFAVIRAHLSGLLASTESGRGFLGGQVTFCALKPMRSIPFRVICMIGMNDGSFPRHESPIAFDLIAAQPRRGDRSLRDDDRYLFLESILSARDALYFSYSGLSIRDNAESPPCALLSELLDYLDLRFTLPSGRLREDWLVRKHRLQAFHADYFHGGRLQSFSMENAAAAQTNQRERQASEVFAGRPLPARSSAATVSQGISLQELVSFYSHPARTFLRDSLGLRLPNETAPLSETEPLELDRLQRYGICSQIIAAAQRGADPAAVQAWMRASGCLPHGYVGELDSAACFREANALLAQIRQVFAGTALPPKTVHLSLGRWTLGGALHDIHGEGLLRARPAKIHGKDLIRAWIEHLALNALAPAGVAPHTWLFGSEKPVHLSPVAQPLPLLHALLEHYERGMTIPLPFFPKASWVFAQESLAGKDPGVSLESARKVWAGGHGQRGECDPENQLAFRGHPDPLDAEWQRVALAIFEPLIAAVAPIA